MSSGEWIINDRWIRQGWTDWRAVYALRPGAIIEVDPKNIPTIIHRHDPRCGYCGHPPGDGRHKCLNCGAPK